MFASPDQIANTIVTTHKRIHGCRDAYRAASAAVTLSREAVQSSLEIIHRTDLLMRQIHLCLGSISPDAQFAPPPPNPSRDLV